MTGSTPARGVAGTDGEGQALRAAQRRMLVDLRELIAALDRRAPRLERLGETDISRDAAALRDKALARIAHLEGLIPRRA